MPVFTTQLVKKEQVADGTMAFYFDKPAGFRYIPGQYATLIQINPFENDAEGSERCFTIASNPLEEKIMIVTRMRDTAFKRNLREMLIGSDIKVDGPEGSFVLPRQAGAPVVFIVGGIGVTPARSMITYVSSQKSNQKITLIYANSHASLAVFDGDFKNIALTNPNFQYVPVDTGISGHVSIDTIKQSVGNINDQTYYLSGPPGMVGNVLHILLDNGVNKHGIITEEFDGY
ncbi:FAD-dependent oxidoreductase [Candidatus Saccharibacteria bacterium]|nr:FAD-dependent oxidoreductase [Candidatus Saccharibacteria bacterium]